jgi:hypothetical protein
MQERIMLKIEQKIADLVDEKIMEELDENN